MKKLIRFPLLLILATMIAIAGCSSGTSPKAALEAAMKKTIEADSYRLSMAMQIEQLELGGLSGLAAGGLSPLNLVGLLEDATIHIDAIYNRQPMRTDMMLDITLPGMMDMKLSLPLILTEKEMYFQLPEIPLLLPESATGKYIRIDLEQLASKEELEASESDTGSIADMAANQKLIQELSVVWLKHFEEKTYFSELKAADAGLPEGLQADRVVRFAIDPENEETTIDIIASKVMPEVLDILIGSAAYTEADPGRKAKLEDLKRDWDTGKTELVEALRNETKLEALEMTGAIKDQYMVYQKGKLGIEAVDKESGRQTKLAFTFAGQYSDINKAVPFEQELPTEAIEFEQLIGLFRAPVGM